MLRNKLLRCAEGLVITVAGVLFVILSLGIRSNPVSVEGVLNIVVQAKFIPLLLSVLLTLQGISLTAALYREAEQTVSTGMFSLRAWTVVVLTVAYLLLVSLVGFAIPTVVYIGALLFSVNRGRKPLQLLALTALYSILALLVIPGMLNLQLL